MSAEDHLGRQFDDIIKFNFPKKTEPYRLKEGKVYLEPDDYRPRLDEDRMEAPHLFRFNGESLP